jgi:hypothetical protein
MKHVTAPMNGLPESRLMTIQRPEGLKALIMALKLD